MIKIIFLLCLFLLSPLFAKESQVSIQLQWKHQFQSAGFYVAKEKGFYRDVGLDVTIKEYDHGINIVEDVVSQKTTFGIGKSSLLLAKHNKRPVVVLNAIYQHSPSVLITIDPSIKELSDLVSKKVMITQDTIKSAAISGMFGVNGISTKDLDLQQHSFNYKDLINSNTDAMGSYISNEPFFLKQKGIKYKVFDPKEYGLDFYGDLVFTSKSELQDHKKRVTRFQKASNKGWLWAFDNIEVTAKLIHKKYNTQNKSLESLIYEGYALKKLALVAGVPFGMVSTNKFRSIAKVFQLKGMVKGKIDLKDFLAPLKTKVKIGVLAKRGTITTHKYWNPLATYLNENIDGYEFIITPLNFEQLYSSVENKNVDFIITNTMYYVLLENKFGISRIATLLNSDNVNEHGLKKFGGVIFTKKQNTQINTIKDLKGTRFGAVSKLSFGGWVMAYKELLNHGIDKDDLKLRFLHTHDQVVKAVLNGDVQAGSVRTDTLERMSNEGSLDLSSIKIIQPKHYTDFPFLVSTQLYPEWPLAKMTHTSDALANNVLATLINIQATGLQEKMPKWTVPLDYSMVHSVLKELRLAPYEHVDINFKDIFKKYTMYVYISGLLIALVIIRLLYDWYINMYLSKYNTTLDLAVKEKTKELLKANKQLKVLANKDSLTQISNRGHLMSFAQKYFELAQRNKEKMQVLSLDLDYFKKINDTYGHQAGDCVLREFSACVLKLLRKSDLFGRVGGEEFCIILQNTSTQGATMLAKRVCTSVETLEIKCEEVSINVTVSIGLASLTDENKLDELIKKSDIALYEAKKKGRNQVSLYTQS